MATLLQVRDKANAKLALFWTALQTRQDAYFAKHGKYFQLLAGSDLTLDGLNTPFVVRSPSDEKFVLSIDTAWSDTVPFKIVVDEWVGVGTDTGYRATVTINYQGTLYQRTRDSKNVDSGWAVYSPIKL